MYKSFCCLLLLLTFIVSSEAIYKGYAEVSGLPKLPTPHPSPYFPSILNPTKPTVTYNWTLFGTNMGAVSNDCPYVQHGDGTNITTCEMGCASAPLCNVINFNPSIGDCVYRACSDPNAPYLTPANGYNVYGIYKIVPPLPSNSSLEELVGPGNPFPTKQTISFFGDSLTWLGYYLAVLEDAIAASPYTSKKDINLVNRGINGGTVKDIRDGGNVLGVNYPSFKECLILDRPQVIAIQIGINDVWFPTSNHSSTLPVFKQILENDLVEVALSLGIKVYLETVSVIGEKREGEDPHDAALDAFALGQILVAAETGVPVINLRQAYQTFDAIYNVDDVYDGILTYDGVHPNSYGAVLLANHHARGILAVAFGWSKR